MRYEAEVKDGVVHLTYHDDVTYQSLLNALQDFKILEQVAFNKKVLLNFTDVPPETISFSEVQELSKISKFEALMIEDLIAVFVTPDAMAKEKLAEYSSALKEFSWDIRVVDSVSEALALLKN